MLTIINQVFEISQKAEENEYVTIQRNLKRIFNEFEQKNIIVINPIGRPYKETDTDIEANLSTVLHENSKITKVLKPIVYTRQDEGNTLIQKGIVIVD